jgi:osmotically-inducible protein OsmY
VQRRDCTGPAPGRGPKDYQRSDERIREELCDAMTDDDSLDASEISIQVQKGEVTLTGSVSSRDQKRRAEDLAEAVSGVRDVTNNIRVAREGSEQQGAQLHQTSSQSGQTGMKGSKSSGVGA